MTTPRTQTAVIQSKTPSRPSGLPLAITSSKPVPEISSPYHVVVRVLAVGLNPTDYKMITHFFMEGNTVGCDFCGIVESAGALALVSPGERVCGADFPYRPDNSLNGAFAQYAVTDSRHVLRVPENWSDTQAAALGAIGWCTACLAISDPGALNLKGMPSRPTEKPVPVLVYGGATATGLMAIQMLKLLVLALSRNTQGNHCKTLINITHHQFRSGYDPIAVCSPKSAPMVMEYGAVGTASYLSSDSLESVQSLANGLPIKYALDCITDAESTAFCYATLARVGARYACLEDCPESWRTRRAVKYKAVMGFEALGFDVDLNHPVYTRKANFELHGIALQWAQEIQSLLDQRQIKTQPIREIDGQFEGVIRALEMLQSGEVKGEKLVVRV